MDLTSENKLHIDSLGYDELLRHWRFAPAGDPWFQGETGVYWSERMFELRKAGADHVGASKRIGWEREGCGRRYWVKGKDLAKDYEKGGD